MAIGAVIITLAAGWVGFALIIDGCRAPSAAGLLGAVLGLLGGTVLTLFTAFQIGGTMERFVGVEPRNHRRMPVTGWSLQIGDRRVAHFFATHMMQVLPLLGYAVGSPASGPPPVAVVWGRRGTALVVLTFDLAERGRPFWALSTGRQAG